MEACQPEAAATAIIRIGSTTIAKLDADDQSRISYFNIKAFKKDAALCTTGSSNLNEKRKAVFLDTIQEVTQYGEEMRTTAETNRVAWAQNTQPSTCTIEVIEGDWLSSALVVMNNNHPSVDFNTIFLGLCSATLNANKFKANSFSKTRRITSAGTFIF